MDSVVMIRCIDSCPHRATSRPRLTRLSTAVRGQHSVPNYHPNIYRAAASQSLLNLSNLGNYPTQGNHFTVTCSAIAHLLHHQHHHLVSAISSILPRKLQIITDYHGTFCCLLSLNCVQKKHSHLRLASCGRAVGE